MSRTSTDAARLAEEYVRLGGKRKAKLDDNIVSTRLWDDEPQEAADFWRSEIETLSESKRQVETNLPNMNPG
ncbi:hypothetical protein [Neorhizobium galegae]|uniref:hypothetical protein n=1 Tax=Neorhizobium galegae TaxID=399 RepID=UPI0009BABC75|nr:hypothetical protein [Neorhizobium galegae]KAB1122149.1 hypothetical protein F4V90_23545 [Neorhizobium galegae]MCQ1574947.1 hypothetical protein [Neorhizobium galegae]MCQ1810598.1 hypothetical protein [Neorhizobium galegae]MCQ1837521.1 hypothetical protein [Neorhizobium galegae]